MTFLGNMNADSVVHHKLLHSVRARFVRFVPLEWNPNGKIGMRVEVYGCSYKMLQKHAASRVIGVVLKIMLTLGLLNAHTMRSDVADFDGQSSLLYRFNQKTMSTLKDMISLKFKSIQEDGVLFHGEGQRGDHITLELQKGRLALYLNLDDSKAQLRSAVPLVMLGSLLGDQHWHSVLLERVGKQVNFTVDMNRQHFRTKGETDALDIDYEFLSFGGIPVPSKPGTFLKKNFHGCIENLYYNAVNIIDLAKRRKHQIYSVGNVTFSCSEQRIVPITFVNSRSSYLLLPGTHQIDGVSVSFQFRTWNEDGLLLSTELSEGSGTLLLFLEGGTLRLLIKTVAGHGTEVLTGFLCSSLNDGLWHSVSIIARRNHVTLTLDNDAASPVPDTYRIQIYSGKHYYFGDVCQTIVNMEDTVPKPGLPSTATVVILVTQEPPVMTPSMSNHVRYIDTEGTQLGSSMLTLMAAGHWDPYKYIAILLKDKIWMIVHHNNTELTWVHGSSPEKPYSMTINYGGSMEQLEALIEGSEHCEQEVKYHCRRSLLLNTPDGAPFTWWIGRSDERHPYWGGSVPGVQHCGCGLEDSCLDNQHFCNCDADTNECSPSEITFAIDVGNGPIELIVQSPYPLNDDQWHFIRAETNLKETSLQVDNLPQSMREVSEEGHFQLQLNSQLFVGGTSSRQKGFLGCIRSLLLNGHKADLEERAKVTSGVRPGCPGHCSSYGSNCRNGGKCVEKHSGYSCDCTNSPYEGPFCQKEISALFDSGTSVTYMFQEPYSVTKNASLSMSAVYTDTASFKETIMLSFMTAQSPTLLLYLNFSSQNFLAILLSRNGSLQVRYRLSKDGTHVFTISTENLANRRVHQVKISRDGPELSIQMDQQLFSYNFSLEVDFQTLRSLVLGKVTDTLGLDAEVARANTLGFVGCLSSVQYNHIVPLKAALRHASIAPVTVQNTLTESSCGSMVDSDVNAVTTVHSSSDSSGNTDDHESLTNAGKSDSAIIGGVIAVGTFITFCVIGIMTHFLYQHKQSHSTNQMKKEYPENLDSSIRNEIDLQNTAPECKQEYFI
ncbi:Contactin-associated protein-like 5-2 [Apodemus speciosus]|uniref:Contactin-associated protein-like 5-2 n=1 Tax=Apodemus speciosus TaxID=105296 RepID=A0ABQ0EES5_APOSI